MNIKTKERLFKLILDVRMEEISEVNKAFRLFYGFV